MRPISSRAQVGAEICLRPEEHLFQGITNCMYVSTPPPTPKKHAQGDLDSLMYVVHPSVSSLLWTAVCFKHHVLLNCWVEFHQTSQKWAWGGPLAIQCRILVAMTTKRNTLQKSCQNYLLNLKIICQDEPLPKLLNYFVLPKNMLTRRRSYFFLYIFGGNLKNIFVIYNWPDLKIIWHQWFWGESILKLLKLFWSIKKHGLQEIELVCGGKHRLEHNPLYMDIYSWTYSANQFFFLNELCDRESFMLFQLNYLRLCVVS